MPSYDPARIEPKWQKFWVENKIFRTPDPSQAKADQPKYYVLDMFPYPSGAGLHVGHPEGYTATDILARFKRMNGFNVLHPMGWDAYGLPAEQYAIENNIHPRITTQRNIDTFRGQIQALGFSYDWDREVDTTDPGYFCWTQWIFLLIHDTWFDAEQGKGRPISELPIPESIRSHGEAAIRKYQDSHRLAYQAEVPVNWCPYLGTVLANEEVIDGKSERGGHPVERRPLRQWLMRITSYAQRLLDDLDPLDWSESIKQMQRNWIGKSEGAEVDFKVTEFNEAIRVFTTRPDTLFGATYVVLSPEHPLVETITTSQQLTEVLAYRQAAARKSEFDRTDGAKKKTGVFTGAYAINPVNGAKIPIWIADYVLATYGTGAIMAVPAHDERDFAFAQQFHLPITTVVRPNLTWLKNTGSTLESLNQAYVDEGETIHSGFLDGLTSIEAKEKIIRWLEEHKLGQRRINFKLRDWLFSRQRYWGEPFPILHEVDEKGQITGLSRSLNVTDLPLTPPELEDFKPTGTPEGPLSKSTDWVNVTIDGQRYVRETNTMPQWAGSCWYFLRYIDPKNVDAFADPSKLNYWLPVDIYVGGAEHAVLHLLYSRFWHKVLFDRGYLHCREPFQKLVNQGMILGEMEYHLSPEVYSSRKAIIEQLGIATIHRPAKEEGDRESYVLELPEEQVEKRQGKTLVKGTDIELTGRAEKMSKSRGNVVNPDDIIKEYGADSLRLYEMFMGPLEAVKPWNTKSVEGVYRFLSRIWRLIVDDQLDELKVSTLSNDVEPDNETLRLLHRTIKKVTEDTEGMRFNTAISTMMELSNHLTKLPTRPRSVLEKLVLLLAPYAPHIGEELWSLLGHKDTLAFEPWPKYDPALIEADEIEVPVQINGKLKTVLKLASSIDDAGMERAALADEKVKEALAGKTIKKVIVKSKKLVNLVVG